MIAVDTNILVYAHRQDTAQHSAAFRVVEKLTNGNEKWGIPWPCVHEFLAVVTNRKLSRTPSSLSQALAQMEEWFSSPSVQVLQETAEHWSVLRGLLQAAGATRDIVHDARIAAICIGHGVRELWTADRDFERFAALATFNPLDDDLVHETSPTYGAILRARTKGRQRQLARRGA